VHKKLIVACIAKLQTDGSVKHDIRKFPVFFEDLIQMREWLLANDCHHVLMESTGKYWVPLLNVFKGHLQVYLTHPKYVRAIKGKKTDENDAERIADLFMNDQVRTSFIPPEEICELRTLCRYRVKLVNMRSSEKARYQDCMTVSNVTLAGVLSDSFGKSGIAIMERVLSGEPYTDEDIKPLIFGRAKAKTDLILKSVRGCSFTFAQRLKIMEIKDHLKSINEKIQLIEDNVSELAQPYAHLVKLLCTMPGIDTLAAIQILSEIGCDMSVFESSKHLTNWAGLAPCNDNSAGKKKSTRISKAGAYIKPLLVQCANAAVHSKKEPYFANKYWRLRRRKDHKRAIVAIARMMLTCVHQMLTAGEVFRPADLEQVGVKKKTSPLTVDKALAFLAEQGLDVSALVIKEPLAALPPSG
jgi:transposase